MNEIRFDTGIKTFNVNDCCEIAFNPADNDFVNRLYNTLDALSKIQDKEQPEDMEPAEIWKYAQEKDKEIRSYIDALFGDGKADLLFSGVSTLALANGMPLWLNFFFAILDEIDETVKAQTAETDKRVKALNDKYGGYMAKYGKKK